MTSKVYFADMSASQKAGLLEKVSALFVNAGLSACVGENDLVAVKVHFGELGNTGYLSPIYARTIIDEIKRRGGKPFLTDSNTLYKGKRQNAVDHIETALANGFSFASVGAPLIISDGLWGKDYRTIALEGDRHCSEVKIGAAAAEADAMIVLTHFKGHMAMGFGGAFKNVGMGLGARSAKQVMHSNLAPEVTAEKCTRCGDCVKWCPVNCITLAPTAVIDRDVCIGCGECTATCRYGAIAIKWSDDSGGIGLQERVVEHFAGAIADKDGKVGYMNFLLNVTPDCDCWQYADAPIVADIGVLASTDPVAIDQASMDLVNAAPSSAGSKLAGADVPNKFVALHGVDPTPLLEYAEKMGLGTREYELIPLKTR